MKRTSYRFVFYVIVLLVIGSCKTDKTVDAGPFEQYDYFDFDAEVARLQEQNPLVEKSITLDGSTETQTLNVAWQTEFALFTGSDINQIQNKDRYRVEVTEDKSSGSKTVSYAAQDDRLPVQLVEHTFASGRCTRVFIKRLLESQLQSSWKELEYLPGKGYRIVAHQEVEFTFKTDLEIVGRIIQGNSTAWRAELDLGEERLPFNFDLWAETEDPRLVIHNGKERIEVENVVLNGDSIFIDMPVFLSEFKARIDGDNMSGLWYNHAKGPDYQLKFSASKSGAERFASAGEPTNFDGKWEVDFSPGQDGGCKAIGLFNQMGSHVTGTFITETGDYRFLEGAVNRDTLLLSTFDGSHAFLFKAFTTENGVLSGSFWSGNHWKEPWVATLNPDFELRHPDSLTYLVSNEPFNFSVQDRNGNEVSLDQARFDNKVTIVQIIGSWCPNCLDESAFLSQLHNQYANQGLDVVALCFERFDDADRNYRSIDKLAHHVDAQYDFYLAGKASKKVASEYFPMLSDIISFPTTVFIDRSGKVRKIHTGFYGPGTEEYYDKYVEDTRSFIESLLNERAS